MCDAARLALFLIFMKEPLTYLQTVNTEVSILRTAFLPATINMIFEEIRGNIDGSFMENIGLLDIETQPLSPLKDFMSATIISNKQKCHLVSVCHGGTGGTPTCCDLLAAPSRGGRCTGRSTWEKASMCEDLATAVPLAGLLAQHGTALVNNAWGHLPPLNYRSVESKHMGTAQQVLMANSP